VVVLAQVLEQLLVLVQQVLERVQEPELGPVLE
jgi:hypothetical protein